MSDKKRVKISYNNINYYIATNMRGDVEGIYDEHGQLQARYIYDSWGKVISILDGNNNEITDTNHIGHINPIRYRGYYYDTETGFYYLQSRYYDPEVGRFISADFQLNSDITGNNLYIYCGNNPVNYKDDEGTSFTALIALKVAFDIICDIVVTSAVKEAAGEEYTALDLCSSVVSSIGTALIPTVIWQGIFAGTVELFNCALQDESLVESVSSVSSAVVGTVFTMNNAYEYLTGVKFDDVSKLINDLTYGSIEYIGLTVGEVFISCITNKNSKGTINSISKPLHEIVNFKEIPLPEIKKTGYGFCPR